MTVIQLIHTIKEDHHVELNSWQKQFIEDLYDGVDGIDLGISDLDLREYLSEKQIEKVYEIAEELGI